MTTDVLVVGGGLVGCAAALELARAGLRVRVLERSVPGAEASTAAAGILGPSLEAHAPGPLHALGLEGRALHVELAAELRDRYGIDVGLRTTGAMEVAFDEAELRALAEKARWLRNEGVRADLLDAAEARALEPALAPDVLGALDLPEEAQLEPPLLLRALALAAEDAGATFVTSRPVREIVVRGDRVAGVHTDGGGLLEAEHVIVAAGSWTSLVPGLGLPRDAVIPVRGQIVATETRPPIFRRVVIGGGGYVVARPDGRALLGSTEEHVGFERGVTIGGLATVTAIGARLAPKLASAPVLDHWSSFRPTTPDRIPIVGRIGPDGLWVASGHYRNGILLAPITGRLLTEAILGRPRPVLAVLDPRRLTGGTRA